MTNKQINELIDMVEEYWDEESEVALALCSLLKDYDLCKEVIESELKFNMYKDISTWKELAEEIIYDDVLWEDEEDLSYRDTLAQLVENDDSYRIKEMLINGNWALDTENEVAIGFDDSIVLESHEI